jgi:thermostable 8-oxoguanine DNA glycosylase
MGLGEIPAPFLLEEAMLVDPIHFTNYHRNDLELEATAIFSVLVAGKTALTMARALERLLKIARQQAPVKRTMPFKLLREFNQHQLARIMLQAGVGCYNQKARTIYELVRSGLDLRTCTAADMERVTGIGPKTSRLFILHTRRKQRLAVLDVHILRYLRELGHNVPIHTPGSSRRYAQIEALCLMLADQAGLAPADWDLSIWNYYRERHAQRARQSRPEKYQEGRENDNRQLQESYSQRASDDHERGRARSFTRKTVERRQKLLTR